MALTIADPGISKKRVVIIVYDPGLIGPSALTVQTRGPADNAMWVLMTDLAHDHFKAQLRPLSAPTGQAPMTIENLGA